jgi:hypothetical protein
MITKTTLILGITIAFCGSFGFSQDTSKTVQLIVTKAGDSAGTITSSPPGIHCGDTAQDCTATFRSGTGVTLRPEEGAQDSVFTGWSTAKGSTTPCEGVKDVCSFTITENSTINGTFTNQSNAVFTINITVQGSGSGVVHSVPEGVVCGDGNDQCTVSFPANGHVSLIAAPSKQGSVFQGWSGGTGPAVSCNSTNRSCDFSISENTAVTATFDVVNTGAGDTGQIAITASKTGNGSGLIVSSPPGIECGDGGNVCSASYPAGTTVQLSAKPTAAGSTFAGWTAGSGSASSCMGSTGPCAVVLTEESSVTGTFVQK